MPKCQWEGRKLEHWKILYYSKENLKGERGKETKRKQVENEGLHPTVSVITLHVK